MHINHRSIQGVLFLAAAFLTACGGGGGGGAAAPAPATYTIGGTISGLGTASGLKLQNNGGDELTVASSATTFTFATKLASGAPYSVLVSQNPTGLTCTASINTGNVASANVTSVVVTCSVNTYSIGGTISGLTGTVVLRNNGGDNKTITNTNGSFTFTTEVAHGAGYAVTVFTQPIDQRCTVTSGGSGTATADVSDVVVDCVTAYTISATVSGLGSSIGLVLQDKWAGTNSDIIAATTITGNGTYPFSQQLITGETYNVRALIQPAAPALTCTAASGIGAVAASGVNVAVACAPPVPRYAYVANANSDDVSAFTIDVASGVLASAGSAVAAGVQPYSVTVDPTGRFAYVANVGNIGFISDISAYTIDAASGVLTQVDCGGGAACGDDINSLSENFLAGMGPHAVTVDPTGQFAYVANVNSNDISAYTIDQTTGELTQVDCGGGAACDVDNNLPKNFLAGIFPSSVTIDHTGRFAYVTNADGNSISAYSINTTTGALTQILCGGGATCGDDGLDSKNGDNFLAGAGSQSLDIDPTSRFVYVANNIDDTISAFKIESTGALTQIVCGAPSDPGCDADTGVNFLAGDEPISVAVGPLGDHVYVANRASDNVSVFDIENTPGIGTGELTELGSSPYMVQGTFPQPAAISIDLLGQYAYVANYNAGVSLFSIAAGVLTQVDCGSGASCVPSFGYDFLAGSNPQSVITAIQQQ